MNELVNKYTKQTMTLKEITDLLEIRHNDAMKIVEKMAESREFGELRKFRSSYINNLGVELPIETYQLDKRQSIAVSARLNTDLLMRVIDRWMELEVKVRELEHEKLQWLESERDRLVQRERYLLNCGQHLYEDMTAKLSSANTTISKVQDENKGLRDARDRLAKEKQKIEKAVKWGLVLKCTHKNVAKKFEDSYLTLEEYADFKALDRNLFDVSFTEECYAVSKEKDFEVRVKNNMPKFHYSVITDVISGLI